jgi:hypothetical protein
VFVLRVLLAGKPGRVFVRVPTEDREVFKPLEVPEVIALELLVPRELLPTELLPIELLPIELVPSELLPLELVPMELLPIELLPMEPLLTVGLEVVLVVVRLADVGVPAVVVFKPETPGVLTVAEPDESVDVVVVGVPVVVDGVTMLVLVVVPPRSLLAAPVEVAVGKVAPPAPSKSVLGMAAALVAACAVASVVSMTLRSILIRV